MMSSQGRPARQRSIRLLLAMVFVIPLVSLLALWGYAASVTVSNAIQEHNFTGEDKLYGGAAETLGVQLAMERQDAFVWLISNGTTPEAAMLAQFHATHQAVIAFLAGVRDSPGSIVPSARPALASFEGQLARLGAIEAEIQSGQLSALPAFQTYNSIADSEFDLYSHLVYVNNVTLYQQAQASVEAGQALDMADREVALIDGALANGLQLNTSERQVFAQSVTSQRLLMSEALKQLSPTIGAGYRRVISSPAYRTFQGIENSVAGSVGSKAPVPVNPSQFAPVARTLFTEYQAAESQNRVALSAQGTSLGNKLLLQLALAGGLGLLAVALSVFLLARFGRRISGELRTLQNAALELSGERLPRVVERLSQGEEVDVAAEVVPPALGHIAEISRVSEAFATVQRMAVQSAVGQARLRRGVSQVFRNLAWRSQSLLHRQLSLLDAMERKTTDPDALDELFRVDHLTTRMRRHAEGLIILSGAEPGRAWREPVPMLDVLRGAIAEIEDYKRVTVITDTEDAVVGSAVADLIHLLAELIENATFYSPASTEVSVRAGRVANGFVVEVEDRGIGISDEELASINERLASPPEFDPVNSDQLGLFVVARLAARQNIKVTIRQSPYGGTGVVVLLPHAIVVARGRVLSEVDGPGWLSASGAPAAIPPPSHPDQNGGADLAPSLTDPDELLRSVTEIVGPAEPADQDHSVPDAADSSGLPAAGLPASGPRDSGPGGLPVRRPGGNWTPAAFPATSGDELASAPSDGAPVLPRRVRQASLAPQLRADVSAQTHEQPEPDPADGRSPDESRALVDALQFGWQRGRLDADQDDDGWTPTAGPEPAPPADGPADGPDGSSPWAAREGE